jgi:hypothetical protein
MRLYNDFAGIEIVQLQLNETPGGFAVLLEDAVGGKFICGKGFFLLHYS